MPTREMRATRDMRGVLAVPDDEILKITTLAKSSSTERLRELIAEEDSIGWHKSIARRELDKRGDEKDDPIVVNDRDIPKAIGLDGPPEKILYGSDGSPSGLYLRVVDENLKPVEFWFPHPGKRIIRIEDSNFILDKPSKLSGFFYKIGSSAGAYRNQIVVVHKVSNRDQTGWTYEVIIVSDRDLRRSIISGEDLTAPDGISSVAAFLTQRVRDCHYHQVL